MDKDHAALFCIVWQNLHLLSRYRLKDLLDVSLEPVFFTSGKRDFSPGCATGTSKVGLKPLAFSLGCSQTGTKGPPHGLGRGGPRNLSKPGCATRQLKNSGMPQDN
jgi:hypothetical protein